MQGLRFDLVLALRHLRRAPGVALAAVATLAIGIGATTAIFSFVAAVLATGSPVDDMQRLVAVWSHNRREAETKGLVSRGDFLDWSARARTFESMVGFEPAAFNLSGTGAAVRISAQAVTPGYLEFFRWQPAAGRSFVAGDFIAGAPRVMIVTDAFWRSTLGAAPDVVGRVVRLDREPATIIGVLPPLPATGGVYVPLSLQGQRDERTARTMFVWARMREGVSIEQARAEMTAVGVALEQERSQTNGGWSINTRPLQEEFVGPQARLAFGLLSATVLAVLLIGCVNVANLLLARGVTRRGEISVRVALGAGRWRVARQLFAESFTLALLGALGSVFISRWTIQLLVSAFPIDSPWVASHGMNVRAFVLTATGALVATLAAGLLPALAAGRTDVVAGLQAAGRSGRTANRRLTNTLVASEIAMAVLLIVVAGLLSRTLIAIERLDNGFDVRNVLTASVTLPARVPADGVAAWIDQAVARARALPGVIAAGATSRLPFAGGRWNPNAGLEIEGRAVDPSQGTWAVDYLVTPGLLESLHIAVIEGRAFSDADGRDAPPVAIVNRAMARRFWSDRTPLGARLRHGTDPPGTWRTVVGIVADVRNDDADQPPLPYLYMPIAQRPTRTVSFALRTASDPLTLAEPLQRAIADLDPDQALYDIRSMEQLWEQDLAGSRLLIQVFEVLAAIALGLAGIGIWGVASHSVGQRTREIGVRVALGATSAQVTRLIARQGLTPVAAGLAVGLLGGLGAGQLLRSVLFQTSPTDPVTLGFTVAVLGIVALIATLGPALRAARLDPLRALREN
jgi:putative ABC transport system permease protein